MQEMDDLESPKTCKGGSEQLMPFTLLAQIIEVGRFRFNSENKKKWGVTTIFLFSTNLKSGI